MARKSNLATKTQTSSAGKSSLQPASTARDSMKEISDIRRFYLTFPIRNAVRAELTWTHYRLLLKVERQEARNFYMLESINNNRSTRELERQINSLLYERLALSIATRTASRTRKS
ncbi:MAG: DUF1016 N-terminal domain-containing protein [Acidobacteriota bacterium]